MQSRKFVGYLPRGWGLENWNSVKVGIFRYLRERSRWILVGLLVGFVLGYLRAIIFEPVELPESARLILATQIAFAFAALSLFICNYLEFRQRVITKAMKMKAEEEPSSAP